jgi:mannose-6-phosphate isomerase-like protein (cupin superfamily)
MEKVNLAQKFSLFDEHWSPKIVGELNGQEVRLAKISGEFIWHKHDDADEFFLVVAGKLTIHLRDDRIELEPGEFFIVPRGVEHKPESQGETHIVMFEPTGTTNTGNVDDSERTVTKLERI